MQELTIQEFMILVAALTAIGVLIGLGYGIHALRLMRDQPNRSSLRLAALSLLEPSVTIGTLLVVGVATDAWNSSGFAPVLLYVAGVPLTVMLLAPLVSKAESPLHRVIAVYGLLRWLNTIALWVIGLTASDQLIGDDTRILLVVTLIASGLVLLIASLLHIGSSLDAAKTQSA